MLGILIASVADIVTNGSGYPAWIAAKGVTEMRPWPVWCVVLIVVLITASVMWIPLVAICRAFGTVIVDDNEKAWFPANALKEYHGVVARDVTMAETILFCIREDGTEGCCCPTGRADDYEEDEDA